MSENKLVVVDPKTGIQLKDMVLSADLNAGSLLCGVTKTVTDEDETESIVMVKEKNANFQWVVKTYKIFCDFDVVNSETGEVIAESRYMNVTTRI